MSERNEQYERMIHSKCRHKKRQFSGEMRTSNPPQPQWHCHECGEYGWTRGTPRVMELFDEWWSLLGIAENAHQRLQQYVAESP